MSAVGIDVSNGKYLSVSNHLLRRRKGVSLSRNALKIPPISPIFNVNTALRLPVKP